MKRQFERCNLCGLCNENALEYLISKDEVLSPRFKAWQLKNEKTSNIMYLATLNPSLDNACPAKIPLSFWIRRARAEIVKRGEEPQSIKDFKENFLEKGSL